MRALSAFLRMRPLFVSAFAAAPVVAARVPTRADTIHVPEDFLTIQQALDAASSDDDIIIVAEGTYNESIEFPGLDVTLRSTSPQDPDVVANTIIDGSGLGCSVVTCDAFPVADPAFEGFTVTGGDAPLGGGMYVALGNSPHVQYCVFTTNTATTGAGVYNSAGDPAYTRCTFSSNIGDGVYNYDSGADFTECEFTGNTERGMRVDGESDTDLIACSFYENQGGGLRVHDDLCTVYISNCHFVDNYSNGFGGGMHLESGSVTIINDTEISGNSIPATYSGGGIYVADSASIKAMTDCVIDGNTVLGSGDGEGGGIFLSSGSDVTITSCSICNNESRGHGAGILAQRPLALNDCDLYNNTVKNAEKVGGGILAYQPLTIHNCHVSDNRAAKGGGVGAAATSTLMINSSAIHDNHAEGSWGGGIYAMGNTTLIGCDIHHNESNDEGGGVYIYPDLNLAINDGAIYMNEAGQEGGGIYANNGTLSLSGDFQIYENVATDSGGGIAFAGTFCTIDGGEDACIRDNRTGNDGGGMWAPNWNSGFVRSCRFEANVCIDPEGGYGGGLYLEHSPDLERCEFIGNGAVRGSAVYVDTASPRFLNCRFLGNVAGVSGGVYIDNGSPELINCEFSGNEAGARGGALRNKIGGSPVLANCTIAGNSADRGGGIWHGEGCSMTVTNTIMWGNESRDEPEAPSIGGDGVAIVTYSDVELGPDGIGNIEADPFFVDADGADDIVGTLDDDLRVATGSLCIDAADNTAVPEDTSDLDGDGDIDERIPLDLADGLRFLNDPDTSDTGVADPPDYPDVVDMGAFEFDPDACPEDLSGDHTVDVNDLLILLGAWGTDGPGADLAEPLDIVNVSDLLVLLGAWGECP